MWALFLIAAFSGSILTPYMPPPQCAGNAIYPTSDGRVLNKDAVILLEFYADSQQLIDSLNLKYPVYLQSSGSKVALLPIEILKGEFRVTQVILKPASELIQGKEYQLHIDNLPEFEREPNQYNPATGKPQPVTFTVSNNSDHESPVFSCSPFETKKAYGRMGCGPSRIVYFQFSGSDKSKLFVRATVKNMATGKSTTYIVETKEGQVQIGHGMCSGPFHFDDGDNYEVSFRLFDQSGNEGKPSDAIAFTSPQPVDTENKTSRTLIIP